MPLTYPQTIDANTSADAAEVQANFDAIKTYVDTLGEGAPDTTYRTIMQAGGVYATFTVATFYMLVGGSFIQSTANLDTGEDPSLMYFDDADYTLDGETPVCRLRTQLYVNASAPEANATVGLHNITACAGTANVLSLTADSTAVTGSTATFTTPSASTRNTAVTSDFAVPADGHYVFGVTWSAIPSTNNAIGLTMQLQVKVEA